MSGLNDQYKSLLGVQTTTSYKARHKVKGNRTRKLVVETLGPLKEECDEAIPEYIKLDFMKRSLANKCRYSLFRLFKVLFVSIWFYYAPFVALLFNFIVPLFIEKTY